MWRVLFFGGRWGAVPFYGASGVLESGSVHVGGFVNQAPNNNTTIRIHFKAFGGKQQTSDPISFLLVSPPPPSPRYLRRIALLNSEGGIFGGIAAEGGGQRYIMPDGWPCVIPEGGKKYWLP